MATYMALESRRLLHPLKGAQGCLGCALKPAKRPPLLLLWGGGGERLASEDPIMLLHYNVLKWDYTMAK